MFEIQVNHRDGSYLIHGERGALARAGRVIKNALPESRRALVVTDEHVRPLYLKALTASLHGAGFDVAAAAVGAGREAKTLEQLDGLYRASRGPSCPRRWWPRSTRATAGKWASTSTA